MTDTETRICTIPFSGFYESIHDANIDSALEIMVSDDSGEPDTERLNAAYAAIDWRKVHLAYAQEYASTLADECAATWQFVKLVSPREYNFRTDEIDVSISMAELQRMMALVDRAPLAALVAERLAPRSGFAPFYSDDLEDWGDLAEWDAPQLSLLVEAYCDTYETAEHRDCWILDDCNGGITGMLEDAMPEDAIAALYGEAV
jgi:hypothetical protein